MVTVSGQVVTLVVGALVWGAYGRTGGEGVQKNGKRWVHAHMEHNTHPVVFQVITRRLLGCPYQTVYGDVRGCHHGGHL